ncbi:MAG: zinc-ribbon domain-containing protein [Candidatus Obscuribacterales bacterium]|nr:zinc-ribbon domain-containing protein [Candidatus Obscuribacterales bacterium]
MRKHQIVEIEDVQEAFCGIRRRNLVPLCDARPDVADEWLYSKNAGWGPEHFSRASGVKCWWQCSDCLREYKAQISNRTSLNSGCPYCASKKVCSDNALSDVFPKVAVEWHPKKNGKQKPSDVTYASGKRAWWLCRSCKHEWNCVIADRTILEAGCPACYEARLQYAREHPEPRIRNRLVLNNNQEISRTWYEQPRNENFVSIAQSHPSIAKQWHPTKNGKWTAFDFSKGSDTKVWWKCKKGPDHEWQAQICSRTSRKSGCPFCGGKRVSITNSLKTRFPTLAKEWHAKRNGKLKPEYITYGSAKKVWWKCKKGPDHEWQATPANRTGRGTGCLVCARKQLPR